MEKDYIQELIDDLIKFKAENKIKGYEIERQMKSHRDGPGLYYGDELYIKFTIVD